jgi:dTDP-4-dehydrorhamnose reductase
MKPRILITGARGQVGRELSAMLPQIGEITATDRASLDLAKPDQIRDVVRRVRPNLIVNAAAYTAVDKAESEEALAYAVNARAPAVLAEGAKKIGAALMHYSTDYVFDGAKKSPYVEEDLPNPINVYGRTKLEGECAIQRYGVPHLIFRTSWVYATEGRNFLLTILRLATEREELRIVSDQIGAPTTSRAIAVATKQIVNQCFAGSGSFPPLGDLSGIYHMTARGETSWYGFAEAILSTVASGRRLDTWFAHATKNLPILTKTIAPISTQDYPTPAQRPAYSILSNEKLARVFSVRLPSWRDQLSAILLGPFPKVKRKDR